MDEPLLMQLIERAVSSALHLIDEIKRFSATVRYCPRRVWPKRPTGEEWFGDLAKIKNRKRKSRFQQTKHARYSME